MRKTAICCFVQAWPKNVLNVCEDGCWRTPQNVRSVAKNYAKEHYGTTRRAMPPFTKMLFIAPRKGETHAYHEVCRSRVPIARKNARQVRSVQCPLGAVAARCVAHLFAFQVARAVWNFSVQYFLRGAGRRPLASFRPLSAADRSAASSRGEPRPGGHKHRFSQSARRARPSRPPVTASTTSHARRKPGELACIIGKARVLDKMEWRNPILFGAAVFSHPLDDPACLIVCR